MKRITTELKSDIQATIRELPCNMNQVLKNLHVVESESKAALYLDVIRELRWIKEAMEESSIIAITDRDGNITYANKMFCELSKYSQEELLGQNHRILKSGHHPPEFYEEMWKVISQGKVWRGIIKNKAKDGSYYWVKTVIVPILGDNGKPESYISIRTDITEQLEFQEKNLKLQKLAAIGEMAARFSHDMRNPLSIIKNSLEILKIRNQNNVDEKSKEILERIGRAIIRISHQVDDVLDFVKPPMLVLKMNALSEILRYSIEDLQIPADIKVTCQDSSVMVLSDFHKLSRVFANIILNAIQAIVTRGEVDIRIKEDEKNVSIEIEDTGPAIPDDVISQIFEPLFTTKLTGTGLGLVTCKNIVEHHGGTIIVKNDPVTFTVTLPKERLLK